AMSTSGTDTTAFTLPAGLAPSSYVYIPADGFAAAKVRLIVAPTGVVSVQAQTNATDATNFTSLEGASYALTQTGYTALPLINGWGPYGTRPPMVSVKNGIVRFQGAISGGTTTAPFMLSAAMSPPANVYVTVDMYLAAKGRLIFQSSGAVINQAQ